MEAFVATSRLYAKFDCPVAHQKFSLLATVHDCETGFFVFVVFVFVFVCLFVCLFVCVCVCMCVCLSACLFVCLFEYLNICLFVCFVQRTIQTRNYTFSRVTFESLLNFTRAAERRPYLHNPTHQSIISLMLNPMLHKNLKKVNSTK